MRWVLALAAVLVLAWLAIKVREARDFLAGADRLVQREDETK